MRIITSNLDHIMFIVGILISFCGMYHIGERISYSRDTLPIPIGIIILVVGATLMISSEDFSGDLINIDIEYADSLDSDIVAVEEIRVNYRWATKIIPSTSYRHPENFNIVGVYLDGKLRYPYIQIEDIDDFETKLYKQFKK